MRRRKKNRRERGASLVEFAIVLPLLVMLLFGIIEFGWAFAQNLEVKHVAREVGRLVTVDAEAADIDARACGGTLAEVTEVTSTGTNGAGSTKTVTVTAQLEQITGFFAWALGGVSELESTVEVRLEQDLTKWSGTTTC